MTMTAHTAGPWAYHSRHAGLGRSTHAITSLSAPHAGHVAFVYSKEGAGNGSGEANARLIAAAPDMLAALRTLEHAAAFVPVQDNSNANPDAVRLRAALTEARAAIAKAEGAQP